LYWRYVSAKTAFQPAQLQQFILGAGSTPPITIIAIMVTVTTILMMAIVITVSMISTITITNRLNVASTQSKNH